MKKVITQKNVAAVALIGLGMTPFIGAAESDSVKHMHAHLDAMKSIEAGIIAGNLDATREPATWLLEHDEPAGLPAAGSEFVATVRGAASALLEADSLGSAAEAASQMGLACGACHTASNVTVEFDEVERPSDKEKAKPHMQRHQWAADRMWEGLIGPDGVAFSRGANLLFESPVKPAELAKLGGGDAAVGMSRRIHQLAANATTVSEPEEQAEIYAEFIANCGACHSELAKGP
jgi:mono/diheme cytochrome c family protein